MVAPTPKKALFEGNFSSNAQPLFFEFAFEPTPASFQHPTTLLAPIKHSKRKKVFYTASRLVLGLLITALVLGSGLLNNELLTGNSGTQASLSWIPSWLTDSPTAPQKVNAAPLGTTAISETPSNPDRIQESATSINAFSSTVALGTIRDQTIFTANAISEPETVVDEVEVPEAVLEKETVTTKEATDPAASVESVKTAFRPILKPPVSPSGFKLSTPVVNREEVAPKKLEITSDAFHAINKQAALDGKKVFIKFGARWCLPCKMMEANVFPDPEISLLLAENYHTLTVDVDKLDGINLRQVFEVEAIPSFVILDSNQNLVGKHEGAKRIDELRRILGAVTP